MYRQFMTLFDYILKYQYLKKSRDRTISENLRQHCAVFDKVEQ